MGSNGGWPATSLPPLSHLSAEKRLEPVLASQGEVWSRAGPGDVTSWLSPSHQLGQQYRLAQEPVLSQISSLLPHITPSHPQQKILES